MNAEAVVEYVVMEEKIISVPLNGEWGSLALGPQPRPHHSWLAWKRGWVLDLRSPGPPP